MSKIIKNYAYAFLALRVLIDLTLSIIIYRRTESFIAGFALMPVCCVFYFFLYFGIRNEEFRGRYGRRINVSEPFAYWLIVGFLIVFHLIITALMINFIL